MEAIKTGIGAEWISRALSPGRTLWVRGLLGWALAPAFVVLPCSLLFLAFDISGVWPGDETIRRNLDVVPSLVVTAYGVVTALSIAFGAPTWMVLRLTRSESGLTYLCAGLIEGLVWEFLFSDRRLSPLSADHVLAFAFCSLLGGAIALAFWLVARDPPTALKSAVTG